VNSVGNIAEILVHTGQHYDGEMSQVFFDELDISKPRYHLGIGSATHGAQTGRMLEAIEQVLLKHDAEWVITYGDTNSTLAAAVAAVKLHIPTAHVEAGLRSYNRQMPEEINRVLTDHASDLLFVPTEAAVENLRREGLALAKIHQVGDVMYDVALYYSAKAEKTSRILDTLNLTSHGFALATVHRAENTDSPSRLRTLLEALRLVGNHMPVVIPLHPRTRARVGDIEDFAAPGLRIISPVGYLDMITLEKHAAVIATDSGGVQKEAYFYQVPCVTLRNETEWVELVQCGWNRLQPPTDARAVADAIMQAIGSKGVQIQLYGGGEAAYRIVKTLEVASLERPEPVVR
jgi:UDP-GlcNAc3NAcA epimerase